MNDYAALANLTVDYASGWYLPTVAELSMLYRVKATVNANETGYTYSDGTTVAQAGDNSTKYFKVEPIKWRVLNPSAGGNKILVAESILTANVAYYDYYDADSNEQTTDSRASCRQRSQARHRLLLPIQP